MNKKLVYILPEATEKTHMKYNVEFVTALEKEKNIDIYLIIERGELPPNFREKTGVKTLRYTGNGSPVLRILKLNYYLIDAWRKGYNKVYIHYSFISAFFASLYPFFTTYYWNCGLPWKYKRPFFQELYETTTYKLVDFFVTGTQNLSTEYSGFYKFNIKKSLPIPNWIDLSKIEKQVSGLDKNFIRQKYNLTDDVRILFFNQRLATRKGIMYLPKILKNVKDNLNDKFICIVTNDGPDKNQFLEEIKKLDLEKNILTLGKVPNDEVIKIMFITDLYLLPSEEEGMSHSLMEAFATGTPAVAFDVGGTKEMYPESLQYLVLDLGNVDSFSKKTLEILNNREKAEGIGKLLKEKIKKYDKNIVLDEFVNKVIS